VPAAMLIRMLERPIRWRPAPTIACGSKRSRPVAASMAGSTCCRGIRGRASARDDQRRFRVWNPRRTGRCPRPKPLGLSVGARRRDRGRWGVSRRASRLLAIALAARVPRGPGDPGRADTLGRDRRRWYESVPEVDPEEPLEAPVWISPNGRGLRSSTTIQEAARSAWPGWPASACWTSPGTRRRCASSPRRATAAPAGRSTFPAPG
jgi:hypothetical protein